MVEYGATRGLTLKVLGLAIAVGIVLPACGGGSRGSDLAGVTQRFAHSTGGGISIAVIARDGTTELFSAGSARRDGEARVEDATSFRLASVSKTIAVVSTVKPWPEGFGPSIVPAATAGACA